MKERVVREARHLLYERGPAGTTMDHLARRLGVSKKTLYKMFDGKEALIGSVLDREIEALTSLLHDAVSSPGPPTQARISEAVRPLREAYRSISGRYLQELATHYPFQYERPERWWAEYAHPRLVSLATRAMASGVIPLRVSPEALVSSLAETIAWTAERRGRSPIKEERADTAEVLQTILAQGLFGGDRSECNCLSD